jgi:hypothetical protein
MSRSLRTRWILVALAGLFAGCSGETGSLTQQVTSSCMLCHNGSLQEDYAGPGIENPHPFPGADTIACTTCHGGDRRRRRPAREPRAPPPEIGDRAFQTTNARA